MAFYALGQNWFMDSVGLDIKYHCVSRYLNSVNDRGPIKTGLH